MDFAELSGTAGLFFVAVHGGGLAGDGFLVWNLGFARQQVDLEFGLSPANGYVDVLVAHAL